MDIELFELCREVYRRTAWCGTALLITKDGPTMVGPMDKDASVPLYTSDYLLEKLSSREIRLQKVQYSELWGVEDLMLRDSDNGLFQVSEVPLKALLKLVIALDDAVELAK